MLAGMLLFLVIRLAIRWPWNRLFGWDDGMTFAGSVSLKRRSDPSIWSNDTDSLAAPRNRTERPNLSSGTIRTRPTSAGSKPVRNRGDGKGSTTAVILILNSYSQLLTCDTSGSIRRRHSLHFHAGCSQARCHLITVSIVERPADDSRRVRLDGRHWHLGSCIATRDRRSSEYRKTLGFGQPKRVTHGIDLLLHWVLIPC